MNIYEVYTGTEVEVGYVDAGTIYFFLPNIWAHVLRICIAWIVNSRTKAKFRINKRCQFFFGFMTSS